MAVDQVGEKEQVRHLIKRGGLEGFGKQDILVFGADAVADVLQDRPKFAVHVAVQGIEHRGLIVFIVF